MWDASDRVRLQVNQAVSVETVGDTGQLSSAGGVVSATTIDSLSVRFPDLKAPLSGFVVGKIATLRVTSQQGVHSARSKVLQVISAPFVVLTLGAPTAFTTQQQRVSGIGLLICWQRWLIRLHSCLHGRLSILAIDQPLDA